jgi:hypothetical protein
MAQYRKMIAPYPEYPTFYGIPVKRTNVYTNFTFIKSVKSTSKLYRRLGSDETAESDHSTEWVETSRSYDS